jgi:hypothetical protein
MRDSQLRFIRQLGVTTSNPGGHLYDGLMFQPRIIACVTVLGIVVQSPWPFLILSAVLWWGTLIPSRNVFDAIYNHVVARARRRPGLEIATAPRRFAQAMAGTVTLLIGAALLEGVLVAAWILQGLLVAGVSAAVFGDFCGAAQLYTGLRRAVHWAR